MPLDELVILDRIYAVALDPERYIDLMQTWEEQRRKLEGLRPDMTVAGFDFLHDARFESHIERAGHILETLVEQKVNRSLDFHSGTRRSHNLSFVVGADLCVRSASPGAAEKLGFIAGENITTAQLDEGAINALANSIRRVCDEGHEAADVLRLPMPGSNRIVVLEVRAARARLDDAWEAQVLTSELAWPEKLKGVLQSLFGLSDAEADVVRELTLGSSVSDISRKRKRSVNTVRTQVRIILQKAQLSSMVELIRTAIGMMEIATSGENSASVESAEAAPRRNLFKSHRLRDGRRFDHLVLGCKTGRPFMWLPNSVGLYRWTAEAEQNLADRNLRMIVPVRAGYGASSPAPAGMPAIHVAARDILSLLDHLAIRELPIVSLGLDFCLAMHLVAAAPHRFSGVLACGPMLPMSSTEHFKRLHIWQRFMNANARFSGRTLPFLVNAGFLLAQRVGKKGFTQSIYGNSPSDLAAIEDPAVMEALTLGSEPVLSDTFSAHKAFAADMLAMNMDWSDLLNQTEVPVKILCGTQDAGSPIESVRQFVADRPHLKLRVFENQGKLINFTCWREISKEISNLIADRAAR